jgi:trimeric autotransporter adhesin
MSSAFCFQPSSLRAKLLCALNHGKVSRYPKVTSVTKRTLGYALLSLLLIAPDASAQIRSGTITGLAKDPTGAVIVDADVTVTNTGTHETSSTKTTDTGLYTVPYLGTGTYSVSVAKAGFETVTVNGLLLNPGATAKADVTLKLGTTAANVEVNAAVQQLQTASSTISAGVSALVIETIPNITENPLYYATLENNVQPRNELATSVGMGTYNNAFGIGVAGRAEFSAIGVNGGRAFTNDIQLDGLPITGDGFNEAAIIPNQEGLQEVRVISNNFTAEYGHGQAVLEMTTKSGTNAFHGQVNYLMRNDGLNANSFSNNQLGIRKQALLMNNFGGALAGPIWKDKLFFFSSFHYLEYNNGVTNLITVPTALERVGNFTQTMQKGPNGQPSPAQIFNPYVVTQVGANLYQRAPIKPAIITADLLPDPSAFTAATLINSFWPMPNHPAADAYNTNNFQYSVVNTVRRKTSQNRVDFKYRNHSIYGSGGVDLGQIVQPFGWGSTSFNNYGNHTADDNYYGQIGDTVVLSPTLFLDVRYGIIRIIATNFGGLPSGFNQYDAFGIPAATQSIFAQPGAAPVVNSNTNGEGGGSNWNYSLSGGQFANKAEH